MPARINDLDFVEAWTVSDHFEQVLALLDLRSGQARAKYANMRRCGVLLKRLGGRKEPKAEPARKNTTSVQYNALNRRIRELEGGAVPAVNAEQAAAGEPVASDANETATPPEFVKAWLASKNKAEVAKRLKMTERVVDLRATRLRKMGVRLPEFKPGYRARHKVNVLSLNAMIAKAAKNGAAQ